MNVLFVLSSFIINAFLLLMNVYVNRNLALIDDT